MNAPRRARSDHGAFDGLPTQRGLYYGGAWHAPRAPASRRSRRSRHRRALGPRADAGADDVGRAVAAARAGVRPRGATCRRKRARGGARCGRDPARARRRARVARRARQRQSVPGDALRRRDQRRATWTTSRASSPRSRATRSRSARARSTTRCASRSASSRASARSTIRCCSPPARRRAARRRQHAHRQARRPDAAVGAAHRRAVARRVSAGRVQRRHRRPRRGRRAGRASASVAKIGFIGSVAAGRAVMSAAGATLKALTLELGGKNALIACADATPEEVADGVVRGMNFRYVTGQSCNSTSRVFLHDAIHDAALPEIVQRVSRSCSVGPADRPRHRDGRASSSQAQFDKTMSYIEHRRRRRARGSLHGGKRAGRSAARDGLLRRADRVRRRHATTCASRARRSSGRW